jgi:hypothetical protein
VVKSQSKELKELDQSVWGTDSAPYAPSARGGNSNLPTGAQQRNRADTEDNSAARLSGAVFGSSRGGWLADPSRSTLRVFFSSTFTDTRLERDLFLVFYVPQLRDVCAAHKLELLVCDLRWGIGDHQNDVASICESEIRRCFQLSAGVAFVALLGDKYGYCPLPIKLPLEEFARIRARAEDDDDHAGAQGLFDRWYQVDANLVPPQRVLVPIATHLPGILRRGRTKERARTAWWSSNYEPMQRAMRGAVAELAANKALAPERCQTLLESVTESEMRLGLLELGKGRPETVLLVDRSFGSSLAGEAVSTPAGKLYTDSSDEFARAGLLRLRKLLAEQVPETSVIARQSLR